MAAATATLALNAFPNGADNTQRRQILYGTVTIDDGDYAAGGIGVSFNFQDNQNAGDPLDVRFDSIAAGTSNYVYRYNAAAQKIQIFQVPASGALTSAAPLVELANGAVPSAVQDDIITFRAEFLRSGLAFS